MHPAKAIALILGLMIVLLLGIVIGVIVERSVGTEDEKPVAGTPAQPPGVAPRAADTGIVFGTRKIAIGKDASVEGVMSGAGWVGIHIRTPAGDSGRSSIIIIDALTGEERGRLRLAPD